MNQHTPGPWEVSENIRLRLRTDIVARGGQDWLADCGCLNGLDAAESEANARLMAAALDLLKALTPFALMPIDRYHEHVSDETIYWIGGGAGHVIRYGDIRRARAIVEVLKP